MRSVTWVPKVRNHASSQVQGTLLRQQNETKFAPFLPSHANFPSNVEQKLEMNLFPIRQFTWHKAGLRHCMNTRSTDEPCGNVTQINKCPNCPPSRLLPSATMIFSRTKGALKNLTALFVFSEKRERGLTQLPTCPTISVKCEHSSGSNLNLWTSCILDLTL